MLYCNNDSWNFIRTQSLAPSPPSRFQFLKRRRSHQRLTRCHFWFLRQDRDFASFSLVPRDETEICSIKLSLFNLHGHKKFACTFVMCFGAEWKITTTCTNSIGPSLYYHDQWGWGWMGSAWRNSDYSSGGPAGQPTRPQTNPTLIFIIIALFMVARKSHLCLGKKEEKFRIVPTLHCHLPRPTEWRTPDLRFWCWQFVLLWRFAPPPQNHPTNQQEGKHPLSDFSLNYKQRWLSQGCWNIWQSLARSLFWVLRRDRELSSFSLVPRDENEILSTESRASRQDREFCSQNLGPWDEIENFVPQISKFETRSRFFDHFTKTYF